MSLRQFDFFDFGDYDFGAYDFAMPDFTLTEDAMPLGQDFDTYATEMGMESGNLGYDVPLYDEALAIEPLEGVPLESEDFGSVMSLGVDESASTGQFDLSQATPLGNGEYGLGTSDGSYYLLDSQGNVLAASDPAGNVIDAQGNAIIPAAEVSAETVASGETIYTVVGDDGITRYVDSQGYIIGAEQTATGAAISTTAAQTVSATSGGFSLADVQKLVQSGLSVYQAINQATMQQAAAQRGLTTSRPSTQQTRTIRDPATGQTITQRLNPLTGQWESAGAGMFGLPATIAGLPTWAVLGGGALAMLLLVKPGSRTVYRRRR